jgi:GntR family transcriptional regulator, transcriptional repressor for pyruvate dehydrogenase complex
MDPGRRRRAGRVSESIARRIQNQISDGVLTPGAKLPAERDMAVRYRTSRVSVREAYRSLEELGLLTIRRGAEGGAFITDLDHRPMMRTLELMLRLGKTTHEEITEARLLIEPPIARLAARRALPEDIERLDAVVRHHQLTLERRGRYRPVDLNFHRVVGECARNLPLKTLMDSLSDLTVESVANLDIPPEVQRGVCESHRLIADAIQRHDEMAAEHLMLAHVMEIQERVGRTMAASRAAGRNGRPGANGRSLRSRLT